MDQNSNGDPLPCIKCALTQRTSNLYFEYQPWIARRCREKLQHTDPSFAEALTKSPHKHRDAGCILQGKWRPPVPDLRNEVSRTNFPSDPDVLPHRDLCEFLHYIGSTFAAPEELGSHVTNTSQPSSLAYLGVLVEEYARHLLEPLKNENPADMSSDEEEQSVVKGESSSDEGDDEDDEDENEEEDEDENEEEDEDEEEQEEENGEVASGRGVSMPDDGPEAMEES